MKLKTAIEIAKDCGLKTVDEAMDNINYHAMNVFAYENITKELKEMYDDFKNSGMSGDELI